MKVANIEKFQGFFLVFVFRLECDDVSNAFL